MSRRGFTIAEALVGILLTGVLIGVAMQVLRSGTQQEKQLMEISDLQREARKGIELLQRDIRGMQKLEVLRRGEQGRLESMVMLVPTSEEPAQQVRYAFNAVAKALKRNDEIVLQEALQDIQIWPFDSSKEPQEIVKAEDLPRAAFFKVRVTLARQSLQDGQGHRIFDFLVYPRLPTSVRKTKESRLNQADSRFAPERLAEE